MFDWFLLLFVGAVGLYWQSASRMGELAILCARRECKKYDVQLLDHTVHTIHLSLSRDHNDQWSLWREYQFEYTVDGQARQQGQLVILGNRLIRITLESNNTLIH